MERIYEADAFVDGEVELDAQSEKTLNIESDALFCLRASMG